MPATLISADGGEPISKRQKLSNGINAPRKTARESRIFTPFRTVGLVSSTPVPFSSIPLGKTTFQITTSVGRCLQTYDLKRGLNLVFLTRPQMPGDVTATLAWKDRVFAAWHSEEPNSSPGLWVFKRGKKVEELAIPEDLQEPIKQILIFGSWIVGCCRTRIEIWRTTDYEHYTTLHSTAAPNRGNELTGGIANMPTYLNKIFAGRKDGSVEIWNVSTGKLIYAILPPAAKCGSVTAMQSTTALSLIAIAYSEGPLIIHNILTDKVVVHLRAGSSTSKITSISFRSDGMGAGDDGRKEGVMATAGPENGDVTFWDLNNGGRVMGVLRGAHNPPLALGATVGGGVNKVEFLAGQPVLVTSGLDNSLKSWIFDETPFSPVPRILHSRSGHAAPVTRLQFLPSDADGADRGGKWLLSAGKDRSLWGWSLRRDGQSTELSQGNIRKKAKKLGLLATKAVLANEPSTALEDLKAPEITCIASCLNRDGGMGANAGTGAIWQKGTHAQKKNPDATASAVTGWESVVTGHKGDKYARTWFWGRKKAGRWAFETGDGANVSSVSISPCGTFAVVGSEAGGIDMFNLQSGLHRQRYPAKLTQAQAKRLKIQKLQEEDGTIEIRSNSVRKFPMGTGKHTKAVTGLIVDSLNRYIISCSLDGKVKFWDFSTGYLVDEIDWFPMTAITDMRYHASNDLIALACDDLSIRIVDIETKKTIRELWGCQIGVTDLCFSNDGRWVIAASKDSVVRVWDLPTGHLIDAIRMPSICTALAFSGTGEFLATACEGEVGVNIWNNRTLFTHVPTRHISENEIAELSGPTASGEGGRQLIDGAFQEENEEAEDTFAANSLDQLSEDMMTLSLVPKSRWQTLLHLDLIKQRNKPLEAPKIPKSAPFFLPSLSGPPPTTTPSLLDPSAPPSTTTNITTATERSRITKATTHLTISNPNPNPNHQTFTSLLHTSHQTKDPTPFITHLKSLSPSAADLEIRSLSPLSHSTGNENKNGNELTYFIEALTARLVEKKDYEVVQAWMAVFLRLHGDEVLADAGGGGGGEGSGGTSGLRSALEVFRGVAEEEGRRLGELVGYCGGVIGFLRMPR